MAYPYLFKALKSKQEGKVFVALIQLVTDFEGEPWLIRYMDGKCEKLQIKYSSDGWTEGQLEFMPPTTHLQRHGRLLF